VLGTTQGLAGYTIGQQSVIYAIHGTVRRALCGEPPSPGHLHVPSVPTGRSR
jgi:hypothetical protein